MQNKIKLFKNDLDEEFLRHFLDSKIIAVDCEMMGLNLFRDRLCLVQIADNDKNAALVQIDKNQASAPLLQKLLEADNLKVFHFARTDITWLKHWLNIKVNNFFCTKIASKIARTFTDKHGLKDLCKELLGKELNKNQQSSYWGSSEINKDQIQYAANDVLHLVAIYNSLINILQREDKYELTLRCNNFVNTLAELDSMGYSAEVLNH